MPLSAQTQPSSAPTHAGAAPQASAPVHFDPTKREPQPSLDVDRDPVLSIDAEDNVASGGNAANMTKKPGSDVYRLREDVDEVQLNVAVVDEKGQLVTGLKSSDFRVWEDGVPQNIVSFQHQDLPVSMGILVDNSGSMRDKRSAVSSAALDLVRDSNPQDAEFVVNFNDKAYLDQGFTSNLTDLQKGLSRFNSHGPTAIYDAVSASANELAGYAKWPKQVLLIITDGEDDASRLTLEQTIHRVQQLGGPVVYSIGLLYDADTKEESDQARSALDTLSAETGGISYFPKSLDDVNAIAGEVARDIRNQYTIGYHSTRPASQGGYRTVRVEVVVPHHQYIARTRKGYYPRQNKQPGQPTETAQSGQVTK